MPPLEEGQIFPSLQAFKDALRDWAIECNWTPHILDSDSRRVRAGCRSSLDCPFRIRANYSAKRGDARVTTIDDGHTCETYHTGPDGKAHQSIKRAETGKLKFLLEAVPKIMHVTLDTHILEIIDAVERQYGQKLPTRQAQKVKAGLTNRVKGPCRHCHDLGHTRRMCPQLRSAAPSPLMFISRSNSTTNHNYEREDGNFASGSMDSDSGDDHPSNPTDLSDGQSPLPQASFSLGHPQQGHGVLTQSGQQRHVSLDLTLEKRMRRLHSGDAPMPVQPSVTSVQLTPAQSPSTTCTQPPRTPQESRLEASRLMQQAASLMQEAARLNSEAARLTASVADS